jgi:hypothetical protein
MTLFVLFLNFSFSLGAALTGDCAQFITAPGSYSGCTISETANWARINGTSYDPSQFLVLSKCAFSACVVPPSSVLIFASTLGSMEITRGTFRNITGLGLIVSVSSVSTVGLENSDFNGIEGRVMVFREGSGKVGLAGCTFLNVVSDGAVFELGPGQEWLTNCSFTDCRVTSLIKTEAAAGATWLSVDGFVLRRVNSTVGLFNATHETFGFINCVFEDSPVLSLPESTLYLYQSRFI